MADILEPTQSSPRAIRWTREDCARLEEAGVLVGPYELIEGSINRMGQNMPHADLVSIIVEWLFEVFGRKYVVTQASIDVRPEDNPTNEPMPDALVLNRPTREFKDRPKPADIRLLVEVADSTLGYDLKTKAALYARAEILEFWVIGVAEHTIHVHRDPRDGRYQDTRVLSGTDLLSSLAAPDVAVEVGTLLSGDL
jgi:Uma2 family endonuclease